MSVVFNATRVITDAVIPHVSVLHETSHSNTCFDNLKNISLFLHKISYEKFPAIL